MRAGRKRTLRKKAKEAKSSTLLDGSDSGGSSPCGLSDMSESPCSSCTAESLDRDSVDAVDGVQRYSVQTLLAMRHHFTSVPWHCIEDFKDVRALNGACTTPSDVDVCASAPVTPVCTSVPVRTPSDTTTSDSAGRMRASSCPLNVHAESYDPTAEYWADVAREGGRRASEAEGDEYSGATSKRKSPSSRLLPMNKPASDHASTPTAKLSNGDAPPLCANRKRVTARLAPEWEADVTDAVDVRAALGVNDNGGGSKQQARCAAEPTTRGKNDVHCTGTEPRRGSKHKENVAPADNCAQ